MLLTKKGTRAKTLAGIRAAAKSLRAGDLFFLTYSGHGGQVPDVTGDEADKQDETWCLYDGQLIDDELYFELSRFAAGVRILVLSDSCHSGTVTRARPPSTDAALGTARSKMMPIEVGRRVYAQHQAFYDKLQNDIAKSAGKASVADPDAVLSNLSVSGGRVSAIVRKFKAAVILISGCQDNQTSMDGDQNGAFTAQLCRCGTSALTKVTTQASMRPFALACRRRRRPTCTCWATWRASSRSGRSRSEHWRAEHQESPPRRRPRHLPRHAESRRRVEGALPRVPLHGRTIGRDFDRVAVHTQTTGQRVGAFSAGARWAHRAATAI